MRKPELTVAEKFERGSLLTLEDVCTKLDVSPSTVHRLPIPSIRIGRSLRYDPQDVRKLLDACREPVAA